MLETIRIIGGVRLEGSVKISGAKNASLPILFASVLSSGTVRIENVPNLHDISITLNLLRSLGAECSFENGIVEISAAAIHSAEAPYRFVKAERASFWVLGPLLARLGAAHVALPGGDAIGSRPVDLHLRGLMQMGADVRLRNGVVHATAPGGLHPADISLDFPSVGATHQLMMTASLVDGVTVIRGAAREPEVVELADFITAMGADISGAGTDEITICGRKKLGSASHKVEGDRIEAATFLAAAAITGGRVNVKGIKPGKLVGVLDVFREMGCNLLETEDSISISAPDVLGAVSFSTGPFPQFATDAQPILMAALTRAGGESTIEENIFENRFGHVAEFRRFGADIVLDGRVAKVAGVKALSGAPVEAKDIRAGAGLVVMGVAADGVTEISEIYHLDRGYDSLVQKFRSLGAQISRIPVHDEREITLGC
jgi:UDP-N-acetylglucosamine 1-carboxyvinyltransferase